MPGISHNPYFNRWFSAIELGVDLLYKDICHNPYFNRWLSAITVCVTEKGTYYNVTILILIDGFLQWDKKLTDNEVSQCHNPYFNRWFSAILDDC